MERTSRIALVAIGSNRNGGRPCLSGETHQRSPWKHLRTAFRAHAISICWVCRTLVCGERLPQPAGITPSCETRRYQNLYLVGMSLSAEHGRDVHSHLVL